MKNPSIDGFFYVQGWTVYRKEAWMPMREWRECCGYGGTAML